MFHWSLSRRATARFPSRFSHIVAIALAAIGFCFGIAPAHAAPEIRTSEYNRVPACVTPARLMRYIGTRNANLDPPFRNIARHYKQHGEAMRVRWDYAFFQMIVETNFLTYKTGSGRWGDVALKQNNFAGIGTTGGGVPGDSFPDVSTGVLGQIHHLVVYSGQELANPVAPRTRLKQDEILRKSRALGRPVTFQDLSGRWAVDAAYGRSIEWVAKGFYASQCQGGDPRVANADDDDRSARRSGLGRPPNNKARNADDDDDDQPTRSQRRKPLTRPASAALEKKPAQSASGSGTTSSPGATASIATAAAPPPPVTAQPQAPAKNSGGTSTCKVFTASFGGAKAVLIQAQKDQITNYTVLGVEPGREQEQLRAFMNTHAKDGKTLGQFDSSQLALNKAFELCPKE